MPDRACRHWTCNEVDSRHTITWRCGADHRLDLAYCDRHIEEMAVKVLRGLKRGSRLTCPECKEQTGKFKPMTPVLEGAYEV